MENGKNTEDVAIAQRENRPPFLRSDEITNRNSPAVQAVLKPYQNSLEHLLSNLERIDLLIQEYVVHAQRLFSGDNEFRGLTITEKEIHEILEDPVGLPRWAYNFNAYSSDVREALEQIKNEIDRRKNLSIQNRIELRLDSLAQLFNLSEFDMDVILVCLAPELDLRYERVYAYLQDDITKKRPSVDLALNLLCTTFDEKLLARERLSASSPLIDHQLLNLFDDPSIKEAPLFAKHLKVNERVVDYLLGSNEIDQRIGSYVSLVRPGINLEDLILPANVRDTLLAQLKYSGDRQPSTSFYLYGPSGSGKKTTAKALCRELKKQLLLVDLMSLLHEDELDFSSIVRLVLREATFQHAAIFWEGYDALQADDKRWRRTTLHKLLKSWRGMTFLSGESKGNSRDIPNENNYIHVELPRPSFTERVHFWSQSLQRTGAASANLNMEDLAGKFRFTAGQIENTIVAAEHLARGRYAQSVQINMEDLYTACRMQSSQRLAELAHQVTPQYRWEDIILPPDTLQQLKEISNTVKHRNIVYENWGFDKKLSIGKGLNVLFIGPPGTGKTMAAEVIAKALEIQLYKIDLSQVVSKYIGETEKNLSRIFQEAQADNSILFFDEADALFGKRSEVKDAHDRFANIETGYLLQKMEEHDGIVILASNLRNNIDNAFVRRMYAVVDFPFPDEKHRAKIWQSLFPAEVPWEESADYAFLAKHIKVTGGHIKNIALCAAFLGASETGGLTMRHLILATKREYQKLGKPYTEAEFGKYYEWIK